MEIPCMTQGTQTGALEQPRGMGTAGWWEKGSGEGEICTLRANSVDVQQKSNQYCKAIINQLKIKLLKKEVPAQESKWRRQKWI